jgi:hypothetical protein
LGSENRKYIRFETQDKLYAALGINFSKVGKLRDISINGLSFVYIESKQKESETDSSIVSIFNSEDSFFLPHLGCAVIYDRPLCMKVSKLCSKQNYLIKKCGLRFIAVEAHQKEKLNFFLENYTCGLPRLSKESKLVE